jgi:hypothetical protein
MRRQSRFLVRQAVRWSMLAVSLAACNQWQIQQTAPAELIALRHPHRVRLTRGDQSAVVLRAPEIKGDSMYGAAGANTMERSGIALRDVTSVATRKLDPVATGGLVLGSAALAAGAVVAIVFASLPED